MEMCRSQNVVRTASRTQRQGCDATAAQSPMVTLMLHVACLYYTAIAVVVRQFIDSGGSKGGRARGHAPPPNHQRFFSKVRFLATVLA